MEVNAALEGKTVENALTDGTQLVLALTNGQQVRIKWVDGEPRLAGIDVKIMVQLPPMSGVAEL